MVLFVPAAETGSVSSGTKYIWNNSEFCVALSLSQSPNTETQNPWEKLLFPSFQRKIRNCLPYTFTSESHFVKPRQRTGQLRNKDTHTLLSWNGSTCSNNDPVARMAPTVIDEYLSSISFRETVVSCASRVPAGSFPATHPPHWGLLDSHKF